MPSYGIQELISRLQYVTSGDKRAQVLTAETVNILIDAIKAIARGENIEIPRGSKQSVEGKVVLDFRGGSGGETTAAPTPFKPINASKPDDLKVRITFGIVNNVVPTIGDTALDAGTPPTLAISGTGSIYLMTVWTGEEPKTLESAEVKFTESDVPEDDEDHGHQLLSTVTVSEDGKSLTINQGVTHSLRVERMHCTTGEDSGTTYYGWAGV